MANMRIGLDISMLVYRGSGVANYTFNLAKNLLKYDKKNEYVFFYSSLRTPKNFYYLDDLKRLGGKVRRFYFPPRILKLLWNKHHLLPVEWLIGKVDHYFSSDYLRPPLLKGTKGITTIHDLTWKVYPEFHTLDIVEAHKRKLEKTIKYNDIIIVDSNNTKKDLIKYYPQVNKKKVRVIYPGISDNFRPIKDKAKIERVLTKYNLDYPANYLLYVGAIEPRKNLELSIKVFAELIKDKKFSDYKFILVGRAGWKNGSVFELIKKLELTDKAIFTGFVEDEDLPYFYNAAQLLVYLSEYEGFGLPPIESLACGTKVIASRNSSLEEILLSDNLIDLNVNDIKEIKTRIISSLGKSKIKKIVKKEFTYQRLVNKFLRIL
jgi:glycosyltransferase involved in cell wall biosynthesis